MAGETEEHPFDVAKDANNRVNEMLADTDGAICGMQFTGSIGYHINIAAGETDPEYLWRTALLQALDEVVLEMAFVDADSASGAREQLEGQLGDYFDPYSLDRLLDVFEDKLQNLIDQQSDFVNEKEVSNQ